ncbi:predicted protein [Aspergillus terreus NIH2624]|uniref:DUF7514 domain-containing protein n=1 Tax=Aspergillus terreus (strain NIH 2624 / FGSC A1156) TaxID=341663 RepID=Q0CYE8_ASPTN|nr:uncharacterized protein ATEG_01286 [Aspergillus terreus NIH2624]EAU38043.1 predicted protein [Aspergillus terreus NIH2624]
MAYDDYQSSSSPYSYLNNSTPVNPDEYPRISYTAPPYPSQYDPDRLNMPQPQAPPSSSPNQYSESVSGQHTWQQQQQQPPPPPPPSNGRINEAVSSAFDKAHPSAYLSPEVLSQITATVIQQLKETGLENLQNDQHQAMPPPRPPKQWVPPTAPYNEAAPPQSSAMPNPGPSPPNIVHDSAEYPPPPSSTTYSGSPRAYTRPSPVPSERRDSPLSHASDQSQKMDSRPRGPPRDATVVELTTLEKIWGKLFEDGKPTERLGQFLRGIAVHLIEDYPPGNTLVIVPDKLQKFYEDTKVSSDPYPWQDIFDDRTSSISRLFRDIEAEHHLVQNKLNERPDIPGLTPRGFERWATLMIQAHPDKEYERFQKAVLNMPISNPDNKKERFPKEIPRRLFPEIADLPLRENLDQFIIKHCGVDLPPITDEEIKKVAAQRHKVSTGSTASAAEPGPSSADSDRKPHHASVSAAVDDDDEDNDIPSRPIERQRKPYTAQPGGGKVYEGPGKSMHRRANSSSAGSTSRDVPLSSSAPRGPGSHSPDPLYPRASSQRPAKPMGRSRSPSRGASDYRHSESDLLGHNGGSRYGGLSSGDYYYASGSSNTPNLSGDLIDDDRRYRDVPREISDDQPLYESLREREKEREKSKYRDHLPQRSTWAGEEDYYRGMLGGQGGGPVGGGYDKYGSRF